MSHPLSPDHQAIDEINAGLRHQAAVKAPKGAHHARSKADAGSARRDRAAHRAHPAGNGRADRDPAAPKLICLGTIEPEPVAWLVPARIPSRKLSLVIGDMGAGKSFYLMDLVARVTVGAKWPHDGHAPRGVVVWIGTEDTPEDTLYPRIEALGGDVNQVLYYAEDLDLANGLSRLRHVIEQERPALICIDPITQYLGRGTNSYKDTDIRSVLAPLNGLARETGTSVIGTMHLNKDATKAAVYRASGAGAFIQVPRAVFLVAKDAKSDHRRFVAAVKFNLGPTPPTVAFRFRADRAEDVAVIEWEPDVVALTADQVLQQAPGAIADGTLDAVAFLQQMLADKPQLAKDVLRIGAENGFSSEQLYRAKAKLDIVVKPRAYGDAWMWGLRKHLVDGRFPEGGVR